MSIDDTISCYGNLTGKVFSDKQTGGNYRFKASNLEEVLKDIVKVKTHQEDERMMGRPPFGKGCKT